MQKPYYQNIKKFVEKERKKKTVFPPANEVFSALDYTPLNSVKVVIIGQVGRERGRGREDRVQGLELSLSLCVSVCLCACAYFTSPYLPSSPTLLISSPQDPYHDHGQAHGLCFSVKPKAQIPPSLKNMYKELQNDIPGFQAPNHGFVLFCFVCFVVVVCCCLPLLTHQQPSNSCLVKWAKQGVLLLNASLTVEAHKANSHAGFFLLFILLIQMTL